MEKIGVICRKKIVDRMKNKLSDSDGCIFVDFNKVPAFAFNVLRNELQKEKSSILVSKISLMKLALEGSCAGNIDELIAGPTGMIFVGNDGVVNVCKILFEFSKENEGFNLKGAILNDKKINDKDLEEMSKLPSREVLLAQAVMTMASPLTGFLAAANNIILKFLWAVKEIKDKKEDNKQE